MEWDSPEPESLPDDASRRELRQLRIHDWFAVRLIALITFLIGFVNILHLLTARFMRGEQLLTDFLPLSLQQISRTASLLLGFLLIYLSIQLWQRRHNAWVIATAATLLITLSHIGTSHSWIPPLVSLLLLALLLISHRLFPVRSSVLSIRRGLLLSAGYLLAAVVYGMVGFWLLRHRDVGADFDWDEAFFRSLRELSLIGNSDLQPYTHHARWFLDSLDFLGISIVLVAFYSLFRPIVYHLQTLPHQRDRARALLEKYGGTSLDYFKLWSDKSYFFAHDCCIAFSCDSFVAVSLGDPIGSPENIKAAVDAFIVECSNNGWSVAFHHVSDTCLPLYEQSGLHPVKIGEQAVVNLETFVTQTCKAKQFRHALNRFTKDGYSLVCYQPPHPADLISEVQAISDEWLTLPGRHERGFTLGQFSRDYVSSGTLYVVEDAEGRRIAFANQIPSYYPCEATIDMMRHRRDIPNGVMDFLFMALFFQLHEQGYITFDLGLAAFAGVGRHSDDPIIEKGIRLIYEYLHFLSYKGLRAYKAKFDPLWRDIFLVYQGTPLNLVRTVIALNRISEI